METIYFGDVDKRVEIAKGMCMAFNNLYGKNGKMPHLDINNIEKSIRKQHAKFYGMDSRYDGKGNKR